MFVFWLFGSLVWAADFAIRNVTALPITSPAISNATLVVKNGKIASIGKNITIPKGMTIVDGKGQFLMPGIIDAHSHMGVYAWPSGKAHSDGNEMVEPFTPRVRAEDSFRVQDPALAKARGGGVTTIMVLPGSGNLIGGETVTLKNRPSRTLQNMRFSQAPRGLKMACGENPKRVYKDRDGGPSTRMGNLAKMRQIFQAAVDYRKARKRKEPPPMNHDLETILEVLDGKIRTHIHCYRHDDIEGIYRVMDSFGIQVHSFHHALEAYKVRDMIIKHKTAIATWPDWWGFKLEAYDATPYNAAMVKADGGVVVLHSDSANTVQRMYLEAAKMRRYGASRQQALEMITIDPAKMLGIDRYVGSLEVGKHADLALFRLDPLDSFTLVEKTWIDGKLVYTRKEK